METVEDFPEGRWEFEEVMEGREEGIGGERCPSVYQGVPEAAANL